MAEAADISFECVEKDGAEVVVCHVTIHDSRHKDHDATFKLVATVEVHDSRPVNSTQTLFEETFRIDGPEKTFTIPRDEIRVFSYDGAQIDIDVHTQLKIDDAMIFDTKVSHEQELEIGLKVPVADDARLIVEPRDGFFFFSNLKAIPPLNILITLGLVVFGGILILVNLAIGVHDQFAPIGQHYFYDHFDSDGDSESPIMKALMGCGPIGVMVWLAMKNQLRKYMKFHIASLPDMIRPGDEFVASSLFAGRSRVPLRDVTLRVVASNMEHGQYVRGSGTNRRTVSFSNPVRGVILYEKHIDEIPARMPIAPYFGERFSFTPMFDLLYPPYKVSSSHGLDIHWEIQLLHPEFVDQELTGPTDVFAYEDFLRS